MLANRLRALLRKDWKRLAMASLFVVLVGSYTGLPHFVMAEAVPVRTSQGMRTATSAGLGEHYASVGPVSLSAPVLHYVIQPGDTLWSIAKRVGTTIAALEALNRLTSTVIYAGGQLVVPLNEETKELTVAPTSPAPSPSPTGATATTNESSSASIGGAAQLAYSQEDVNLLAHLVQAEAGTQSLLGQVAVAAVVVNRLKNPAFPKTLAGVIDQPGQFESVTNGTFWQPPAPTAVLAAQEALGGWDPTAGALFYYNPTLPHSPWMNTLTVSATIGAQVFCR